MAYIEKYHMIAKAMLDFEKKACDFYLSLSCKPNLNSIKPLLQQIASGKAKELDIFSGMVTVSSFLLSSNTDSQYKQDTEWPNILEPKIYNSLTAKLVTKGNSLRKSLTRIIKLEKEVLAFYRELQKNVFINVKQIDSLVNRQQRLIASLVRVKEGILEEHLIGPVNAEYALAT